MSFDIISSFRIFTVFQISLICIFLLFNPQRKSKKNILLALFIGSKAAFVTDLLLIQYASFIPQQLLFLVCIGSSFQFLLGPSIYFLMGVLIGKDIVFSRRHLLHLLPFVLHLAFMVVLYHSQGAAAQRVLLQQGFPFSAPWSIIVGFAFYVHFTIYGIAALMVLTQRNSTLYAYTSQSFERNIRFLKFLIIDFIVVWGVNVATWFVPVGASFWYGLQFLTAFNIFFIANTIVYEGLKFPATFHLPAERRPKYEKNLLSEDDRLEYARKLTSFMDSNKPYLNPTLSLTDLAERVALPAYVVSQVLNTTFNQNFYDFVNSYRVSESKRLMVDPASVEKTILEILYQSGFNSKSVYNAAFKKSTGMTPSDYRKKLQSTLHTNVESLAS